MFRAYGENAFTFLFFQQLFETKQLFDPFLKNLKQFSTGKKLEEIHKDAFSEAQNGDQLEVWLFPNFGKSDGFGEPDAIVLYRGFSFWIEVETQFNLKKKEGDAKKSLRQLLRFHYFNQALKKGSSTRKIIKPHLAYMGPTIKNNGEAKLGVLLVAGHGVLKKIGKRLEESANDQKDHYVLLSIQKMIGLCNNGVKEHSSLCKMFNKCVEEVHVKVDELSRLVPQNDHPERPEEDRFWYQYYEGDLKNITKINLPDYVSRKSS